ncbi:hypothetical protein YTPLAS18_15040 [Nitrospira sp.]|nr:hypothetical protein YTPLAS18_15040 [Nitrospira sp.]
MPSFDPTLPPIQFPLFGNSLVVAVPSLLHILLAGLSVGFMILAPILEWQGRSNSFYTELAHSITRFTVVVFSASTVLAVIMVELLIGLFPVTTMWMWNQFRGPLALGIAAFLLQFGALYPYYHYWEPIRRRRPSLHLAMGIVAALLMLIWVLVLDGMGSYMLTPVRGTATWSNLVNPTWLPLALHRFVGNLVMAGYVIAAYGAWRAGRPQDRAHEGYYLSLVNVGWLIGLSSLLLQPFTGLLYAWSLEQVVPSAYEQVVRGPYQYLAYLQFSLIGLLLIGNHLMLYAAGRMGARLRWLDVAMAVAVLMMIASIGHPVVRRACLYVLVGLSVWSVWNASPRFRFPFDHGFGAWGRSLTVSLGILSVLIYLTMGTIRETARRPDTVRSLISLQDEAEHPAAFRAGARSASDTSPLGVEEGR